MARKLEVEILATTLGYTKGLVKAGEQTKQFARTVDDSSKHIGRSLALATGGFVAFAGASEFLRTSIDAARDAGVAQRQLAAQMKASGESFQASKGAIDKAGLALERFGFTSMDSAKALTVLERGTGRISRAIQLQGVAANLARAKNLDLADAANILAKVFGGQETALRRAVPGLAKHAHGLDLIAQAQQKLAGQAAASTTEAERFSATLHDTEVIIGTALLPTLDKALGKFSKWLDQLNRSGKLQKDLKTVTSDTALAFGALSKAIGAATDAYNTFRDAAAHLPGGRHGFLSTVLSGSIFAQFRLFSKALHNVGAEFGFVADNAARVGVPGVAGPVGSRAAPSFPNGVPGPPGSFAAPHRPHQRAPTRSCRSRSPGRRATSACCSSRPRTTAQRSRSRGSSARAATSQPPAGTRLFSATRTTSPQRCSRSARSHPRPRARPPRHARKQRRPPRKRKPTPRARSRR